MKTLSLQIIGFSGFYQGVFDLGDNEYDARYELESGNYDYARFKNLDKWSFCDDYRQQVTELFAKEYIKMLHNILGIDVKMVDCVLTSPVEYNFNNDKIDVVVEADDSVMQHIIKLANDSRYHQKLADIISANHTSRDGFWSFMSNDIDEWVEILRDDPDNRYVSCMIWYLMQIIDKWTTSLINERMWNYVTESTDLHNVQPTTLEAKEEWQLYADYGDVYIEYAQNHAIENSWKEYKEKFLESLKQ